MKNTYIVTGANGFLGNNIIRKLITKSENEIRALVLPNDKIKSLEGLNCKIFYGDVTKKETLNDIFDVDIDTHLYVIHCAAIVYIKSKKNSKVYDVNVNGTKNIIDKVLEKKAKLVYVNSVHAIWEKPNNEIMEEIYDFDSKKVKGLYAKTKAECANYVLEMTKTKNLDACIVHPSGIIGPNDFGRSHLTQLIIDFCNHRLTACVKGGYDFVDVRDVADGIIRTCEVGKAGNCYILSNRYFTIKEVLDTVSEVKGIKKIKTVLPLWFAKLTAPLSELYYSLLKQPPLYTSYSLYTLTSNSHFSNQKARNELNYKNTDFKQTIKDTIDWLKDHQFIN